MNPGALIWKIAREKLRLREGERELTATKIEAALRSTVAKALKGDARALQLVLQLLADSPEFAAEAQQDREVRIVFVHPNGTEQSVEEFTQQGDPRRR